MVVTPGMSVNHRDGICRNVCNEVAYAEGNAGEGGEGPEGVDVIQELIINPEAMSKL